MAASTGDEGPPLPTELTFWEEAPSALPIILRPGGMATHRDGGPSGSHRDEAATRLRSQLWQQEAPSAGRLYSVYLALELLCPGLCRMLGAGGRLGGNASFRSTGAGCLDLVRIRDTRATCISY
jgi:hypothetical protein